MTDEKGIEKMRILRKYLDSTAKISSKSPKTYQNFQIQDDDDLMLKPSSEESMSEPDQGRRKRVYSQEEEEQLETSRKEKERKEGKKTRKLKKKLRKALGIEKDEDIQEFLSNLQVEGIDAKEVVDYLSKNKEIQVKKEEESKKERKKKGARQSELPNKFQAFERSQSSDIEIPQQARTIYRKKDGTIREYSEKEEKERHKKQVEARLAEWERGIAKQDSDKDDNDEMRLAKNNKVWDDPMRRWEEKGPTKYLTSKFEGPPNRFDIKPGFRWDGVIRGNGFENKILQQKNLKKAQKDRQFKEYTKDL